MTARSLLESCTGLIRSQPLVLLALAGWAMAPLLVLLVHVARHGGVMTGAYGTDAFDQMQYLAWIRDEGSHWLGSNLWQIGATSHDYLHPMYFLSGLLWRAGLSIQLALLIWKPVAVLVMFLGFAAYVRHLLPESRRRQAAALFLALFYQSPVLAFASALGHVSAPHQNQLALATDDAYSALNLWGFDHTAITIGLMPVFLIAVERLLSAPATAGYRRGWILLASAAGLLVSWLHPWQGVTLLAIVGAMFVLRGPRRRYLVLLAPAAATVAPLLYGVVLAGVDPSWRAFQATTVGIGGAPWWALVASFGPLAAFAALGLRGARSDGDWMLRLWLLACALVYVVIPEFPSHALSGVTLPLSILAVRGWAVARRRITVSGRAGVAAAVVSIVILTGPAALYHANASSDYAANPIALSRQLLLLSPDQAAALSYLNRSPTPGGVLAPWLLSMSIPGFTGRPVFAGHSQWQPAQNVMLDDEFFGSELKDPTGAIRRAILIQTRARFVLFDAAVTTQQTRAMATVAHRVRRFGSVTIYERN